MSLDKNLKRPYQLVDYDPAWVERFDEIRRFLESVFGGKTLRIEHCGSTSIPGMKAKPVIDVLVTVDRMEPFVEERKKMATAGYEWAENYIAPNSQIFFKVQADGSKSENIHLCETGSAKGRQFLVMRDFLRTFPEKARAYCALKETCFAQHPDDYPAYRAAKAPFLVRLEREAYAWDSKRKARETREPSKD